MNVGDKANMMTASVHVSHTEKVVVALQTGRLVLVCGIKFADSVS